MFHILPSPLWKSISGGRVHDVGFQCATDSLEKEETGWAGYVQSLIYQYYSNPQRLCLGEGGTVSKRSQFTVLFLILSKTSKKPFRPISRWDVFHVSPISFVIRRLKI